MNTLRCSAFDPSHPFFPRQLSCHCIASPSSASASWSPSNRHFSALESRQFTQHPATLCRASVWSITHFEERRQIRKLYIGIFFLRFCVETGVPVRFYLSASTITGTSARSGGMVAPLSSPWSATSSSHRLARFRCPTRTPSTPEFTPPFSTLSRILINPFIAPAKNPRFWSIISSTAARRAASCAGLYRRAASAFASRSARCLRNF
mmetsp:Transcript_8001/g.14362  ORF Transcript_8001/g.14362 Transcript_8001/m.14362 type:complete len:207 (+) Transcript_8001:187-807(+)